MQYLISIPDYSVITPLPDLPHGLENADNARALFGMGLSFTGLVVFAFVCLMLGMFIVPLVLEVIRRLRRKDRYV